MITRINCTNYYCSAFLRFASACLCQNCLDPVLLLLQVNWDIPHSTLIKLSIQNNFLEKTAINHSKKFNGTGTVTILSSNMPKDAEKVLEIQK
jgi:hypothetical protein